MTELTEWEPGDPIHDRLKRPFWAGYLYNFRDLEPRYMTEDDCNCPDRSSWPEPEYKDNLDRHHIG